MKELLIPSLTILMTAGSLATRAQEPALTSETLHGLWRVVEVHDSDNLEELFEGKLLKFEKDTISTYEKKVANGNLVHKLAYSIDLEKKPAEINLYGLRNGKKAPTPLHGIVGLGKDQLKLCWSKKDGQNRPTEFAIEKGQRHILLVLERVKQDPK